jgi:hypothetical protein
VDVPVVGPTKEVEVESREHCLENGRQVLQRRKVETAGLHTIVAHPLKS